MSSDTPTPYEEYDFTVRSYEGDYSRRTLALLYGVSGNYCARPGCPKKIIAEPTDFDGPAIKGQIAHIYSRTSKGPRPYPYPKPTKKIINNFNNLILLCGDCHPEVDGQHRTYTAEQLMEWKEQHVRRQLRTQRSFLPEDQSRIQIGGEEYIFHTLDVAVDETKVRSEIEKLPSGENERAAVEDVYFTRDDGFKFNLTWPAAAFPCPKGGRLSFLFLNYKAGQIVPISFFRHGFGDWVKWPNYEKRIIVPVPKSGSKILIFCLVLALLGVSVLEFQFVPPLWGLLPLAAAGIGLIALKQHGEDKVTADIERTQKAVEFH